MAINENTKQFYPKNRKEWRKWLEKNHAKEKNVGLVMYKKDSGMPTVTWVEAVEEALCFGWIDSTVNKLDEHGRVQFFSPRKPKSNWSKINKAKVEKLIAEGLMTPSGLAMVNLAKETGTWTALDDVEETIIPEDLKKALGKNKKALTHFSAFPRSSKRLILEWILNAKRPETREKRIAETVSMAAENLRANHYRQ